MSVDIAPDSLTGIDVACKKSTGIGDSAHAITGRQDLEYERRRYANLAFDEGREGTCVNGANLHPGVFECHQVRENGAKGRSGGGYQAPHRPLLAASFEEALAQVDQVTFRLLLAAAAPIGVGDADAGER